MWRRSARYTAEELVVSDPEVPVERKRAALEARRHRDRVNAFGFGALVTLHSHSLLGALRVCAGGTSSQHIAKLAGAERPTSCSGYAGPGERWVDQVRRFHIEAIPANRVQECRPAVVREVLLTTIPHMLS